MGQVPAWSSETGVTSHENLNGDQSWLVTCNSTCDGKDPSHCRTKADLNLQNGSVIGVTNTTACQK